MSSIELSWPYLFVLSSVIVLLALLAVCLFIIILCMKIRHTRRINALLKQVRQVGSDSYLLDAREGGLNGAENDTSRDLSGEKGKQTNSTEELLHPALHHNKQPPEHQYHEVFPPALQSTGSPAQDDDVHRYCNPLTSMRDDQESIVAVGQFSRTDGRNSGSMEYSTPADSINFQTQLNRILKSRKDSIRAPRYEDIVEKRLEVSENASVEGDEIEMGTITIAEPSKPSGRTFSRLDYDDIVHLPRTRSELRTTIRNIDFTSSQPASHSTYSSLCRRGAALQDCADETTSETYSQLLGTPERFKLVQEQKERAEDQQLPYYATIESTNKQ